MKKRAVVSEPFTIVPDTIVEALGATKLCGYEFRLIWVIIRKTYGFHKSMDRISYSQLELASGINRRHCHRTMQRLIERKIVTKNGNKIGINSNVNNWIRALPKMVTLPNLGKSITKNGNENVTKIGAYKREKINTKDREKPTTKICEKCREKFTPKEAWHSVCPKCFTPKSKENHYMAKLNKCPNPGCSIQSSSQRIDQELGGCNFCKPLEVD